jgi:hypothetical protein
MLPFFKLSAGKAMDKANQHQALLLCDADMVSVWGTTLFSS